MNTDNSNPSDAVSSENLEGVVQARKKPGNRAGRGPELVEKFVVRLPAGLREQIRSLSDQNHRSMNCEIVSVLETYIRKQVEQQLAEIHGDAVPSMKRRKTDAELRRRLDAMTKEKKAALLELLG